MDTILKYLHLCSEIDAPVKLVVYIFPSGTFLCKVFVVILPKNCSFAFIPGFLLYCSVAVHTQFNTLLTTNIYKDELLSLNPVLALEHSIHCGSYHFLTKYQS